MAHTISNQPYSNLPFEVMTSYNSDLFSADNALHGGGDAGYLAIKARSVATNIALYEPFRYRMDTRIQLAAGFETVDSPVHEWYETDRYMQDTASYDAATDDAGGDFLGDSYDGLGVGNDTTQGKYSLSAADVVIYRVGDKVRYQSSSDVWQYAMINDISGTTLTLQSLDGGALVAASASGVIERLESLRGSDLNYEPQPRSNFGKMAYTFVQKEVYDRSWSERSLNDRNLVDVIMEQEEKLFDELRRGRTLSYLYGIKGKNTLSNGDKVYSSPGAYNDIESFNKQTSNMKTAGAFDATKFKASIYAFFEHNFGGESGGPERRDMFHNGLMGSYLGQAFEDKQRFYNNEFVGGVLTNRFEHNGLGVIDFTWEPILDYKHPIPDASLRGGSSPKAVGLMLPVDECTSRLQMVNEGPSSETFKLKGGDEEWFTRVKSTEGLMVQLKQYCAVLQQGD